MNDILVAGAGIGGLTTALALHEAGLKVRVFEAAAEVRPLGVGINLLPHSVRVLTALGLGDRLAERAIPTAELIFATKRGEQVWQEARGLAAGYRWPQYSIHRGRLQMLLLEAVLERLGPERVTTGAALADWTDDGAQVHARFMDRQGGGTVVEASGAALIGADGIHSAVRRRDRPDEGPPIFSGRMMWRGMVEGAPFLTGRSMVQAGWADQKFVCYPVCPDAAARGRSLINWIAERRIEGPAPVKDDWNRPGDKADFADRFARWNFGWLDVPGLIAATPECWVFPMVDRDPLTAWTRGRVTLLGDAAHPMYPIGSNGASQAILDAECLVGELAAHGDDVPAALSAYDAARRPATSAIVLGNRAQGPDQVLQLVEDRAPDGFADLESVVPLAERAALAERYKRLAGFDPAILNARGDRLAFMR